MINKKPIRAIFACTEEDNVFGNANKLPWSQFIKKDMEIFKEFTANDVMVMGRKTFESLPKKLRGLPHIVISRTAPSDIEAKNGDHPDVTVSNLKEAFETGTSTAFSIRDGVSVIGGAKLITEACLYVDDLMMTFVHFHSKDKRYYDAPVYIDMDRLYKNLDLNVGIDPQLVGVFEYKVKEPGEISKLDFYHFNDKYTKEQEVY